MRLGLQIIFLIRKDPISLNNKKWLSGKSSIYYFPHYCDIIFLALAHPIVELSRCPGFLVSSVLLYTKFMKMIMIILTTVTCDYNSSSTCLVFYSLQSTCVRILKWSTRALCPDKETDSEWSRGVSPESATYGLKKILHVRIRQTWIQTKTRYVLTGKQPFLHLETHFSSPFLRMSWDNEC